MREASFHSEAITLENHQRWFERRLADPDSFLYLFTWDDVPCGQVRIQNEADGAVIGISIDGGFRGKGLSAELLIRASGNFFRQTKISQIFAYIKHENTASQRAFQAAGFIADGSAVVNGVECLKYVRKRQAS